MSFYSWLVDNKIDNTNAVWLLQAQVNLDTNHILLTCLELH